jgi:ferrochelatase
MVNLGTPDSPSTADVRRYLKEFLWDPRVVEVPRPIWWLVLNLVILNTRPKRSAAAYRKIWTEQGSPLLTISLGQQKTLQRSLDKRLSIPVHVALAMRYGKPSIGAALDELQAAGARRVLVLPMYPQYSATTTASVFDGIANELKRRRWLPELRFINDFHDYPGYIQTLADSVTRHWSEHGRPERLVMSFHGIPRDYFEAGDPYYCECQKTGRLLAETLGLDKDQWQLTFQSRLGPKEWLRPYTDESLRALGEQGVKKVDVVCPGFSADCLETLEEIAMENREVFLEAGGADYRYIPCLNDSEDHIAMLSDLVEHHLQGWTRADDIPTPTELAERRARATALGAKA